MITSKKTAYYSIMVLVIASIFVFAHTFTSAAIYAPEFIYESSSTMSSVAVPDFDSLKSLFSATTSTTTSKEKTVNSERKVSSNHPAVLKIPAIGVDAYFQKVWTGKGGSMGIPTNFMDVGWYAAGTVPGEPGTAFIDGHLDNGLGMAGVFIDLGDVVPGDDIHIETNGGETLRFKVIDVAEFGYKDERAMDTSQFFGGESYIKLITCGGDWVSAERTYDKRLVVTARLAK